MTDELFKARVEGGRAAELMEDETLRNAFNKLSEEYKNRITRSAPEDKEARELAYHQYRALGDVWYELIKLIDAGKLADLEIKHRFDARERSH